MSNKDASDKLIDAVEDDVKACVAALRGASVTTRGQRAAFEMLKALLMAFMLPALMTRWWGGDE